MPRKIHGAIHAEGLDKGRALKIARESRGAGVFPLHAETRLLHRNASLSIPALRGALSEDERDRDRITWNLDPRVRERLAETLEWLMSACRGPSSSKRSGMSSRQRNTSRAQSSCGSWRATG